MTQTLQKICEKLAGEETSNSRRESLPIIPNDQIEPLQPLTTIKLTERGWKLKQSDIPTFDGDNPDGWKYQAERYLTFYKLIETEIMESAVLSLQGDALLWFHWEHQQQPITRWEELKTLLLERFKLMEEGTLHEQWMTLQQIGTVAEHQRDFVERATPLGKIDEPFSLSSFVKGLKEDVRRELTVHGLITLKEAMTWSLGIDQKLHLEAYKSKGPTKDYFVQRKIHYPTQIHFHNSPSKYFNTSHESTN